MRALDFLPRMFDFQRGHTVAAMKSGLTVLRLPRGWCVAPLGTDWSHRFFPFPLPIGAGKDSVFAVKLLLSIKKVLSLGIKLLSCKFWNFSAPFPRSLTRLSGTHF
jgi:hypothetical protein